MLARAGLLLPMLLLLPPLSGLLLPMLLLLLPPISCLLLLPPLLLFLPLLGCLLLLPLLLLWSPRLSFSRLLLPLLWPLLSCLLPPALALGCLRPGWPAGLRQPCRR